MVQAVKVIGDAINNVIGSLGFIKDVFDGFGDSVNALLSGDPAAAGKILVEQFEQLFSVDNWEKVGDALLGGLEDGALAVNDAILGSIGISSKSSSQASYSAGCAIFP